MNTTKSSTCLSDLQIPQVPFQLSICNSSRNKFDPPRPHPAAHRTQRIHCHHPRPDTTGHPQRSMQCPRFQRLRAVCFSCSARYSRHVFLMLCRIGVTVWAMCCKDRPVSSLSALQSYFQHKEEKGKTEGKCELCKNICKVQSKQKADKSLNTKEAAQSVFL